VKEKPAIQTLDDLFGIPAAGEAVQSIPLDQIDDFPDHPFHVRQDEAMAVMVESVQAVGIQTPLIVRPKEDGRYEIISGHRRKFAAALAGLEALPCIVRQFTRDEAIIAMIDANLQREVILPSEKAFSYKMKLEALKRQGKRTDLTSVGNQQKLKKTSRQVVAEDAGESQDKIRSYIRLTELHPELLQFVDSGRIKFSPAVYLSHLRENEQAALLDAIQSEDATPSVAQAIKMKQFSEDCKLTPEVIQSIMMEEKPNQKEQFKMPMERVSKFFAPGTPAQKMEDTIVKALELYRQRQRDKKRDEAR
jgi:ParB family chromosome partitioning protein